VTSAAAAMTLALGLTLVAAPARAQVPGPWEVPTAGLVHEAVTIGQRGSAIFITVGVQSDLAFAKLVLAYRPDGEREFRGREMKLWAEGSYRAEIPSQATLGTSIEYYIEANDNEGAPVAGRASAQTPLVIQLTGPRPALTVARESADEEDVDEVASGRRFFVGLFVGSGAGWTTGNGDTNADTMIHPSAFAFARLGQLAPEVGFWLSPTLMLSLQGRFQAVTGTNDVYSGGRVYRTANYAAAGFFKATWLARGEARVHPFFSLAAGGGQIRHVVTFHSLMTCGPRQDQVCVDTIAAGPVAVGPGGGVMVDLTPDVAVILQVNTQLTFPAFSVNLDANLGIALRF
jgi:hypothetical protein